MNQEHNFVAYLTSLEENRGALAALRRGLGQPPGSVPDMYRYVVPRLPQDAGSWTERCHYLIAALYAMHTDTTDAGNLGNHFAAHLDYERPDGNDAIERRFIALLTTHPDDLHIYLRQGISFLRSKDTPVNWHQLMRDVLALGNPEGATRVQKRWANGFWRRGTPTPDAAEPGAEDSADDEEDEATDESDD
jgi:CRISPR system Cascade subunit CasB